jgi:hypothetical protein
MGTLSLGSRISEKLPKVTTRLSALCRSGLAVSYMNVPLCAGVRITRNPVSKGSVVSCLTQHS